MNTKGETNQSETVLLDKTTEVSFSDDAVNHAIGGLNPCRRDIRPMKQVQSFRRAFRNTVTQRGPLRAALVLRSSRI
jgi:hypothetical protein